MGGGAGNGLLRLNIEVQLSIRVPADARVRTLRRWLRGLIFRFIERSPLATAALCIGRYAGVGIGRFHGGAGFVDAFDLPACRCCGSCLGGIAFAADFPCLETGLKGGCGNR